ncbi:hypothetical protein GD1_44 [Paraglaciecola Antarctic GD virus 1]|nr:hypothetical protein GD1_44 [Paraglaciecola Antarctic GD virus 1]
MQTFDQFLTEHINAPLLKKVLAKMPKDAKKKTADGVSIFATGNLAVALGVEDYESVKTSDLTHVQLDKLAKLFKVPV